MGGAAHGCVAPGPLGHLYIHGNTRVRAGWKLKPPMKNGGEGGIRTPDTLSGIAVFKTACFNRSHTSPRVSSFTSLPVMRLKEFGLRVSSTSVSDFALARRST